MLCEAMAHKPSLSQSIDHGKHDERHRALWKKGGAPISSRHQGELNDY